MYSRNFSVATTRDMELIEINHEVQKIVTDSKISEGICYIFNPHTTAAIIINEGADPDVQTDLIAAFKKMLPVNIAYRHAEGNSPSHLLSSLVGTSELVFVQQGQLVLGTWQKLYFCEFDGPRSRNVLVRVVAA